MSDAKNALIVGLRRDAGDHARYMRGETHEPLSWDGSNERAWEAAEMLQKSVTIDEIEQMLTRAEDLFPARTWYGSPSSAHSAIDVIRSALRVVTSR